MGAIDSACKNLTTQGYVVDHKGAPFRLTDIVLGEIGPDEVLVEMEYTGLCHTDLVVQQGGMPIGRYPAVLGHEGVGIVRQIGSEVTDKSLRAGNAVILSFRTCRQCSACLDGRCGSCQGMTEYNFLRGARRGAKDRSLISLPDGTRVHEQFFGQSSLSKFAIVDEQSVVKCNATPEDLRFLAPLACGYLTGAGTILNVLRPKSTYSLAIIGMGAVGLAALFAAKALGVSQIIAVDMLNTKLELAISLGATQAIDTKETPDLAEGIRNLLPDGVDQILDTTGVATLLQASIKALAHDGTLALVGVPRPGATFQVDALDLLLSCKRVIGVIEGSSDPKKLIPQLVNLYKEGKFPIDRLSKVYAPESLNEAIADLKDGSVVKPVIAWHGV